MYVELRNCILTVLLGMFSSTVLAQSDFPVFAYDLYGKWGYCYQGTHFVLPCYDNVVDLGPDCAVFWAQQDSFGDFAGSITVKLYLSHSMMSVWHLSISRCPIP